jgi:hypothetical protein
MKKLLLLLAFLGAMQFAGAISPYWMISERSEDLQTVEMKIEQALQDAGLNIIGKYNPGGFNDHRVIVYTSDDLQKYCGMAEDRGMLAAALKIGIRVRKGLTQITMINPEYLFYVYLRDAMEDSSVRSGLMSIQDKALSAMKSFGSPEPFGGDLDREKLKKYRYMMGMQQFDDPVVLQEFTSFDEGVSTISRNLSAGTGNTLKVFELIDQEKQVAVFGVGLMDPEKGERHFLEIIGKKHLSAMPYEIILEGNTATMLHGRFRFASHWPELTMGTFTKIMSTPGDVEDFMKMVTE